VKLTGEARRVCKRLRIFDLVESGRARRREQLTALLGTSDRTLGNDLRVLRQAGLRIGYLRSGGTYRVDSMHTYFARKLSPPNAMACAAALLVLFGLREDEGGCEAPRGWAECASRKIANGIRLTFKKGRQDLDAVMASFGASA
jgi:predicted DNA-binding transcriptional regulator YafY